jgi:hypothetical protein
VLCSGLKFKIDIQFWHLVTGIRDFVGVIVPNPLAKRTFENGGVLLIRWQLFLSSSK